MAIEQPATFTPVMLEPAADRRYIDAVALELTERRTVLSQALGQLQGRAAAIGAIARCLVTTLTSGHTVLVAGNGGSAAEAQHFAGELVGRFKRERAPYAVLALTSDTATLTAIANDYGYQQVFARQIAAHGRPGDLFVAFSTSGESENLIAAAATARQRRMRIAALTGERPNRLERLADLTLRVPIVDTPVTQELQLLVIHVLCDIVERELAASEEAV